jgi:hypothetical protein
MNFPPPLARQLVPFPGDPLTLKLKKPEALEKALGVKVPASPDEATEVARAHELRVNRRYDAAGAWDRSSTSSEWVDLLAQRAGLAFTTSVLIKACSLRIPRDGGGPDQPFALRRDGQPWRRLREHLVASKEPSAVKAAHALAVQHWAQAAQDELRCGLAFAFCDASWVEAMIDPMFEKGYGRWAVLAAVRDPQRALALMRRLADANLRFQLYEEAVVFIPTLVKTAGPEGRAALEQMIERAWNEKVKKPFIALRACYD